MTGIKQAGEKKLMLFPGRAYPDLAQIQGSFDGPVDHLHALPLLAEHVTARGHGPADRVVAGRTRVIIDVIDTGGTLVRAAQALTDRGATQVIAAATHGVFSDDAVERLEQAGPAQRIITDPLPNPASIPSSRLVVLSSAPLPVRAISEVFLEDSATSLSEGGS